MHKWHAMLEALLVIYLAVLVVGFMFWLVWTLIAMADYNYYKRRGRYSKAKNEAWNVYEALTFWAPVLIFWPISVVLWFVKTGRGIYKELNK